MAIYLLVDINAFSRAQFCFHYHAPNACKSLTTTRVLDSKIIFVDFSPQRTGTDAQPLGCRHIQMAERWGAGSTALDEEDIRCINQPSAGDFASRPTGAVARLARHVQQDSACSACYANLIRALYELERTGGLPKQEIAIGQGWRSKRYPGIGVGNCCLGAEICVQGCPPTAERIAQTLQYYRA